MALCLLVSLAGIFGLYKVVLEKVVVALWRWGLWRRRLELGGEVVAGESEFIAG